MFFRNMISVCFLATLLCVIGSNALSVTYEGLGTFSDTDFYDPIWRPLSVVPESPEFIDPKFELYTPNNHDQYDTLIWNNPSKFDETHFNPNLSTKALVHGFIDNPIIGPWMGKMKNEFLKAGNYNVIIVDWGKGNFFPYTVATANTRVVGAMLGVLIENLCRHYKIDPESFHLLGHSLGAHVVGYAGKRLNGTVGHITGFDPAGPYYEGLKDHRARLWYTDAKFVDSIHTDARHLIPTLGFGMYEKCSHVDFFPNGGRVQPGCDQERVTKIITDGLLEGVRRVVACNHIRSIDFYSESILKTDSTPIAYACEDYESFKSGKCINCSKDGSDCAILGPKAIQYKKHLSDSNQISGKRFFMVTASHDTFFHYQYAMTVKVSQHQNLISDHNGIIKIKFINNANIEEIEFNDNGAQIFVPGTEYTKVFVTDINPDDLNEFEVHWSHNLNILSSSLFVDYIDVKPLSAHVGVKSFNVMKFAADKTEIPNKHGVLFRKK